jgi:hypothetical protein
MLKDISELEIGCVYQYKDLVYDILGVYTEYEFYDAYDDDTNEIKKRFVYHFKTLSSVNNKWNYHEFTQHEESALKHLTKLS